MKNQDGSMAIAITSGARGNVSQMKMSVGMLGVPPQERRPPGMRAYNRQMLSVSCETPIR